MGHGIGRTPTPPPGGCLPTRQLSYNTCSKLHSPVCVSEWKCMDHMEESPSRNHRVSRVSEVWAVAVSLVCLWCPCMSAPTGIPLWKDPCGGTSAPSAPHHDMEMPSSPPDQELLDNIIISAKTALNEARLFSEAYVRNTFNQPFRTHHETWLQNRYGFLPSRQDIPKELGESTPRTHFKLGELDKSLLRSYEYLQRIAVGLEQVHHDKKREKEEFTDEFEKVMYKLRLVLCEVWNALIERNPTTQIIDMERSIMDSSLRAIEDRSSRHLRDWFIYRDFMNCLEYLIDLCIFFKSEASQQ